jgi:hypothetical protein
VVYDKNDYTADGTLADALSDSVPYALTFELFGVPGDLPNCFAQFNPPNDEAITQTCFDQKTVFDRCHETPPPLLIPPCAGA